MAVHGQGGAPVWGDQAPVEICDGALPRLEEKHGRTVQFSCFFEPVGAALLLGAVVEYPVQPQPKNP